MPPRRPGRARRRAPSGPAPPPRRRQQRAVGAGAAIWRANCPQVWRGRAAFDEDAQEAHCAVRHPLHGRRALPRPLALDAAAARVHRRRQRKLQERVGLTVDSKYVKRKFWKEGLPNVDLVFSWAGLDNMKEGNVLRYLQKLSKSGKKHKLVMLGNHAGSLAKNGDVEKIARFTAEGKPLNFRRKPFNLVKPMRMIRDLAIDGNDKQLYLYKPWEMFPKRK
ncbi:hypothetical protein FGB62_77g025 [Gracilaria domingensis]|nr:hypothetical protein FGB62_77g025 [Gracilaria domingensis]